MYNDFADKRIIVFGAGNIGSIVRDVALSFNLNVTGFIDNNVNKQNNSYWGLPVYSVDSFVACYDNSAIVVVSIFNKYDAERIINNLKKDYVVISDKNVFYYEEFYEKLIEGMSDEDSYQAMYKAYFNEMLTKEECDFTEEKDLCGINITEKRERKVIISLTSFPARYRTLHYCIKSLLNQSYKPDKIILYISEQEADFEEEKFVTMTKYGLEIKIVPGNLKSHKKYYYVMQEYPDDVIITVDDDIIYHKNTIDYLIKSYAKYPYYISAPHINIIELKDEKSLKPFLEYDYCRESCEPSMSFLPIGVSGVLYPPHSLHDDVFNLKLINEFCPECDDTWLKAMSVIKGTKVAFVSEYGGKANNNIFSSQKKSINKDWFAKGYQKQLMLENILRKYNVPLTVFAYKDVKK